MRTPILYIRKMLVPYEYYEQVIEKMKNAGMSILFSSPNATIKQHHTVRFATSLLHGDLLDFFREFNCCGLYNLGTYSAEIYVH